MMMQRHRSLNQALQKLLLRTLRLAPNVFPYFMRIVKVALVKEPYPVLVSLYIHAKILAGELA